MGLEVRRPLVDLILIISCAFHFFPQQKEDRRWTRRPPVTCRRVVVPRIHRRRVPVIRVRATQAIVKQVRPPTKRSVCERMCTDD